MNEQSSLSVVR